MFGYATFGTVYGTIICLSGIFTFAQSGLQAMLHHTFEDDPEPLNLGLATAGLVLGIALVMYVDIKGRAMERERAVTKAIFGDRSARDVAPVVFRNLTPNLTGDDGERQALLSRDGRPKLPHNLSTVQERAE